MSWLEPFSFLARANLSLVSNIFAVLLDHNSINYRLSVLEFNTYQVDIRHYLEPFLAPEITHIGNLHSLNVIDVAGRTFGTRYDYCSIMAINAYVTVFYGLVNATYNIDEGSHIAIIHTIFYCYGFHNYV